MILPYRNDLALSKWALEIVGSSRHSSPHPRTHSVRAHGYSCYCLLKITQANRFCHANIGCAPGALVQRPTVHAAQPRVLPAVSVSVGRGFIHPSIHCRGAAAARSSAQLKITCSSRLLQSIRFTVAAALGRRSPAHARAHAAHSTVWGY